MPSYAAQVIVGRFGIAADWVLTFLYGPRKFMFMSRTEAIEKANKARTIAALQRRAGQNPDKMDAAVRRFTRIAAQAA